MCSLQCHEVFTSSPNQTCGGDSEQQQEINYSTTINCHTSHFNGYCMPQDTGPIEDTHSGVGSKGWQIRF